MDSFFLPHYFFTAVHRCCGNIFLPSRSFSHSIIATSGNYKFCSSQTAMDSFFLPHYFFTAVHRCCGNIFLPSRSFSHSIIATSGNYKFCSSQTAMDSFFLPHYFFTAVHRCCGDIISLPLHRGPVQLGRFLHIQGFRRVQGVL